MKKLKYNLIWSYLKNDKLYILIYLILFLLAYIPPNFTSIFTAYALENLVLNNITSFLKNIIYFTTLNIFSYTIIRIPLEHLYNYLEIKFITNISKDLYFKITNLPCLAFEKIGVGEYINRLYNDVDLIIAILKKLIKMICKILVIITFLIISFKINYLIGIEILLFTILIYLISFKYFPKIKKQNIIIKKETDNYLKTATENIIGIREIKALGIKTNTINLINNQINKLFKEVKKGRKKEITYYTLNGIIYLISEFIILITSGYMTFLKTISIADFIIIQTYIIKINEIIESLSDFGIYYNKVLISLKRLDEILNNKLFKDEKFGNLNYICQGNITFKNINFKYPDSNKLVLNNLSFKIKLNQKIAIVGKSGNGKTSIFNLLLRFFNQTSGNIYLDNINIKDLTEDSLRKNISVIRQFPFLFNKTIFDNFKLVKKDVTLKQIREVCKKTYIDDYIMSLPNKYQTIIGEGGVNLSGGEKQRIAIARTLLLNTKIILFDEATSSLDNLSQEYIKKTIDNLAIDHTIIIIAHRLSTIINADNIYLIDNGKFIAKGTHQELLKTSSIYKELYLNEYFK